MIVAYNNVLPKIQAYKKKLTELIIEYKDEEVGLALFISQTQSEDKWEQWLIEEAIDAYDFKTLTI